MQIIARYGVRDRVFKTLSLSILKVSALDLVYSVFLRGLIDYKLRNDAVRANIDKISL